MKNILLTVLASTVTAGTLLGQTDANHYEVTSPDSKLKAVITRTTDGKIQYAVVLDKDTVLQPSDLGLNTSIGDFRSGLRIVKASEAQTVSDSYSLTNGKKKDFSFSANEQTFSIQDKDNRPVWDITFHVDNNNVAFRYLVHQRKGRGGDRMACLVNDESSEFVLPVGTTTYICPQMTPQTGFARTAPSYETYYEYGAEMGKNGHGRGYTFPALFKTPSAWVMLCETGVDGNYCASRLECKENHYKVAYPEATEFGGVGTSAPGLMLPAYTPWRTITVGRDLAPIAETSIMWDLVKEQYKPSQEYKFGKSTWSWVIRMDNSCNFDEQKEYIDLAAALGWQYVLVDAWWDTKIGYDKMKELSAYGASKGIGLFLWYNSNGYWNDAPQGPRGKMHRMIDRRKEMQWLKDAGIKGLKVDFVGSDKQQTIQMYEDILADANEYGLMVIFHGCTIPRGWERMYPNFVSCEAARVSENLAFSQHDNDIEALAATILPILRNAIGNMDFGGSTLNKHYSKNNQRGTERKTSDVYALATAVLFQSPVQNFALTPNNFTDAPTWAVDFMRTVPTCWKDLKWMLGTPGQNLVMARQDLEGKWTIAGVNADKVPFKTKIDLSLFEVGQQLSLYLNNEVKTIKVNKKKTIEVIIPTNGGVVIK